MSDPTDTLISRRLKTARILLAEGREAGTDGLADLLRRNGHQVTAVADAQAARAALQAASWDLAIVDEALQPEGYLPLLRWMRSRHRQLPVVVTSPSASVASAVQAMRCGAADVLARPIAPGDVWQAVRRALQDSPPGESNGPHEGLAAMAGEHPAMAEVYRLVRAVSASECTVLVSGESGTGKSLAARVIHQLSARRGGPMVEVSCGAMAETLLESELFGHVRGAFTDAVDDKEGKFAAAAGGTIFLDEVASASPSLQVKLLRVLQDRQFEPVGSNRTCQTDARVILASNRDLLGEVRAGRFREDLYYRVNVVNIEMPPLRARGRDVLLLAERFLKRFATAAAKPVTGFGEEARDRILAHDWPGNVRELENAVEHAVVLSAGGAITPADLPPGVREARDNGRTRPSARPLKEALLRPEREVIARALAENDHNRKATAEALGIDRSTLYKKMRKLGLLRTDPAGRGD